MKISSVLFFTLAGLSKVAIADSDAFSIGDIYYDSDLRGHTLTNANGVLSFSSGGSILVGRVTDAGKLKFNDGTFAVAQDDGTFITGSESEGSSGFTVSSQHLLYNGNINYYGVSTNGTYLLSTESSENAVEVELDAISLTSTTVADYPSNSTTSTSSYSNSTSSNTTTSAGSSTTNTTNSAGSSSNSSSSSTSVSSHNGAAKISTGLNAVVAALALLL